MALKTELTEGSRVEVYDRETRTTREGTVVDLLSEQFTYETDDGRIYYAFYNAPKDVNLIY